MSMLELIHTLIHQIYEHKNLLAKTMESNLWIQTSHRSTSSSNMVDSGTRCWCCWSAIPNRRCCCAALQAATCCHKVLHGVLGISPKVQPTKSDLDIQNVGFQRWDCVPVRFGTTNGCKQRRRTPSGYQSSTVEPSKRWGSQQATHGSNRRALSRLKIQLEAVTPQRLG